mmetsp:Transcript_44892/g.138961  ORF Transcript_44892/g.138961 Transcript_44892/m.138961 type:complete len:130 (+) Transcript_44892:159-548(+)
MHTSEERGRVPVDRSVVARCHNFVAGDGISRRFYMYDGDGVCVGYMAKAPGNALRSVFTAFNSKVSLSFEGHFPQNSVIVSSDADPHLADTEPSRMSFYRATEFHILRCSGGVDVGLVLCCLFAMMSEA